MRNLPNVTHEDVQKEMIERFSKHGRLVKVKNEKGFYLYYVSSESKWNAINHENGTMFHDQPLTVQPGERILKSKHVVYKSLKHPHLRRRLSRTSISADDYASRFLEVKNLPQDEYEPQAGIYILAPPTPPPGMVWFGGEGHFDKLKNRKELRWKNGRK